MFEAVVHGIFLLLGLITVGCVLLITVYLVISGIPAIRAGIGAGRYWPISGIRSTPSLSTTVCTAGSVSITTNWSEVSGNGIVISFGPTPTVTDVVGP